MKKKNMIFEFFELFQKHWRNIWKNVIFEIVTALKGDVETLCRGCQLLQPTQSQADRWSSLKDENISFSFKNIQFKKFLPFSCLIFTSLRLVEIWGLTQSTLCMLAYLYVSDCKITFLSMKFRSQSKNN